MLGERWSVVPLDRVRDAILRNLDKLLPSSAVSEQLAPQKPASPFRVI
jgi:hypothetical protein